MMCRVLEVSASGYYAWLKRGVSRRAQEDAQLLRQIKVIHVKSRGIYGAPRIHAELRIDKGIRCGHNRVARLMRQAGIAGIHRRRFRGCTVRDTSHQVQPDLVQRQFSRTEPNQLWLSDLTQHRTGEGWLYLSAIVDAFSRRVVGWATGTKAEASLPAKALDMAICHRQPGGGLIHHSDHGCQYTASSFIKQLGAAGLQASMGTVGDALDNAPAESFFATLQTELLDRENWRSRQHLSTALFDYIEVFYNRRRRHSALGYLSPAEYERMLATREQIEAEPRAAAS
jgi:putative transposase